MLRLKRKNIEPPVGWRYVDPDTSHKTIAGDFVALIREASKHRQANSLDIPIDFPDIIEKWICDRTPTDMLTGPMEEMPVSHRVLTLAIVKKATQQCLKVWSKNGRQVVVPDVADGRAAKCVKCELNRFNSACTSCIGLNGWIRQWVRRKTTLDKSLAVCQVCAVMNISQVHFADNIIIAMTPQVILEDFPPACWKKPILEAHYDRLHS